MPLTPSPRNTHRPPQYYMACGKIFAMVVLYNLDGSSTSERKRRRLGDSGSSVAPEYKLEDENGKEEEDVSSSSSPR